MPSSPAAPASPTPPPEVALPEARPWRWWATLGVLAVLGVGYAAQLPTPLRVNVDAVTYLTMAASAADGQGYTLPGGRRAQFPIGYPSLIVGLERLGLATSWLFVGINLLFLGLGLAAVYGILRHTLGLGREASAGVCALTLASWVTLKHALLPMGETVFLGLLMASAWLLARAWTAPRQREAALWWALAAAVALLAWTVRSAGVALLPALAVAALPPALRGREALARLRSPAGLLALGIAGAAMLAAVLWAMETKYFSDWAGIFTRYDQVEVLTKNARWKAYEWAQISLNLPLDRFRGTPGFPVLWGVAGTLALVALAVGLWKRRRQWGPVDALALAYTAMLFAWPGQDPRFWMPMLPLLMGYVALALLPWALRGWRRWALACYLAYFLLAGLAALGYSTRLSWSSPEAFAARYGTGSMRPAYEAALGQRDPATLGGMNARTYRALSRYGRFEPSPAEPR
jgi:hypothetical protein